MKYFKKTGAEINSAPHFLERMFARPSVKQGYGEIETKLKAIGGDRPVEEIPELKVLLAHKDSKRLLYKDRNTGAQYILDFEKLPSGNHRLIFVTGKNKEMHSNPNTVVDITSRIDALYEISR